MNVLHSVTNIELDRSAWCVGCWYTQLSGQGHCRPDGEEDDKDGGRDGRDEEENGQGGIREERFAGASPAFCPKPLGNSHTS